MSIEPSKSFTATGSIPSVEAPMFGGFSATGPIGYSTTNPYDPNNPKTFLMPLAQRGPVGKTMGRD